MSEAKNDDHCLDKGMEIAPAESIRCGHTEKASPPNIKQLEGEDPVSEAFRSPAQTSDRRIATASEVENLLHVVDDIPARTWAVCAIGICERFVWYGATAPLQNYLQHAPGGGIPGALGLGQAIASNIVNALMISSYVTPIPAAVIADNMLGRYNTVVLSAVVEAIGASVLLATSFPKISTTAGLPGVIVAIVFLSVGSGAFKTTVVPLIADQYEETNFRIKFLKSGEKVVTSRELTITYIFNVYYWAENVGGVFADSTPILERYVGFWAAYLVPCFVMWCALIPILVGKTKYIKHKPTQDIVPKIAAALWCGIRHGFNMDSAKPASQLSHHNRVVPWTDDLVENIKTSLLTCRVLLLFPIHWLCFNQTFNNLISQAGQMVTYGIPNDMLKIAGALAGIIVAPIIQKGLYPYLTRHRIAFGPVARITVGFGILSLSMAYAAVLQHLIYRTGPCYNHPLSCPAGHNKIPNNISVFLQLPIYFSGEVAEVFCCTTGTEYAYNRAPQSMKSLVQAIWLVMAGIGSCLALGLSPLAHDPRLVTLYSVLAAMMAASTILMWLIFGHLDKEETVIL
ncbi:POT family-domain-containing protein [Cadophora sp. MPI-SDFR-AT-0126]|nr:POT family-domain-containing protein [Leotiomycetes sp. MPI-SDFR-AT-0126]